MEAQRLLTPPGSQPPTSQPLHQRHGEPGYPAEPLTLRGLSSIGQQNRNRRLPPRDEFNPDQVETMSPTRERSDRMMKHAKSRCGCPRRNRDAGRLGIAPTGHSGVVCGGHAQAPAGL